MSAAAVLINRGRLDEIAAELAVLASELSSLDADLAARRLARLGRMVDIARFSVALPLGDSANPTWAEIFNKLPPMMRGALIHRILEAPQLRAPAPELSRQQLLDAQKCERAELLRSLAAALEWESPAGSRRNTAKTIAQFLSRASARRRPLADVLGRVLELSGGLPLAAGSVRRELGAAGSKKAGNRGFR